MSNIFCSKPKFLYYPDLNAVYICYGDNDVNKFFVDIEDLITILNSEKKFIYNNNDNFYPYYTSNNKQTSILEYIYKYDYMNSEYKFLNGYLNDLRKCNVEIYHKYNEIIKVKYNDFQYIQGHYNNYGIDAFLIKNPIWIVNENENQKYLMYCEKDTIIKLCKNSYQKILDIEKQNNSKITWYKCDNGYIAGKINSKQLYIHQVIMDCYGNGRGTSNISIDHIDRDPLNNMMENLRIATREEQEQNSKGIAPNTKRKRQSIARPLPEGMTQDMLKKYVVYYLNYIDKSKNIYREYFCVEHPKLKKRWETTKSNKISIFEKLKIANKVVEDLENDIYPNKR